MLVVFWLESIIREFVDGLVSFLEVVEISSWLYSYMKLKIVLRYELYVYIRIY